MKKIILLFTSTLFDVGCIEKDVFEELAEADTSQTEIKTTDGMTVLGKQLENPYSVTNMRRAFANLPSITRSGVDETQIETTHFYVKFHPKNTEEINMLKQDSTLIFYSYPLDYDIE